MGRCTWDSGVNERSEALRQMADGLTERMGMSADGVVAELDGALSDWNVAPLVSGGIVGAVITRGNEIHVGVCRSARGKWLSRRCIRDHLGTLLARYGLVRTFVARDNPEGHAFVKRLGFDEVGSDCIRTEYHMRKLNHG